MHRQEMEERPFARTYDGCMLKFYMALSSALAVPLGNGSRAVQI